MGRLRQGVGAALVAGCVLVGGCDTVSHYDSVTAPFDEPIDWWHQLQGGVIAQERPPPPGIGEPYPNLGTIPAKPTPTDAATRKALSARLAGERDSADRLAAQDPIPAPGTAGGPPLAGVSPVPPALAAGPGGAIASQAPAAPAAPAMKPAVVAGGGKAAAPAPAATAAAAAAPAASAPAAADTEAPMARIEAADAPAPVRAPPPAAAPPAPAAIQAAAGAKAPVRGQASGAGLVSGPAPALPVAAPPLPVLAGVPAETLAPATPKPLPQVVAAFVPNSAVLRPESSDALRALAARRAGGSVAVLGGGEARSESPDAQAAALPLAWRRAKAIQDVLVAAGVPTSAMHVDAAALGRGGVARLVD